MESELSLQSASDFMSVKSCIFNVCLFTFQAIHFYIIQVFQWDGMGEPSLFTVALWSLSESH